MEHNRNLDFFFNPRSIAVVGASIVPGKLANKIIESLNATGFKGPIYPVNPKYSSIGELSCYPSIAAIKEAVDLAVFATPAATIPEALKGAGGSIRGAIIVSGGFGEVGEAGKALEKEVKEIARKEGIRIIGPNCMGIYDAISRLDTFFITRERIKRPGPGGLSMISQSGSFALTAIDELASDGVGVARVVVYGNKIDVNESDCLDYLAEDEHTTAVAVYIESIEEGRRFVDAATRCAAKKPVIAVKVGKHGAGITAARSHTGAMAGRYEVYRAAFRKAGIIETEGYEDFLGGCKAYGMQKASRGNRVMIITDGGGIGVGIADACFTMGLEVTPLEEDLKDAMQASMPSFFAIGNPLDLTGSVTDELFAEALEKTMSGTDFDIAIVAAMWGPPHLTDSLVELIAEKAMLIEKPVIICSPGGEFTRKKMGLFRKFGLPVFLTPESAVRAAAVLAKGSKAKGVGT